MHLIKGVLKENLWNSKLNLPVLRTQSQTNLREDTKKAKQKIEIFWKFIALYRNNSTNTDVPKPIQFLGGTA